MDGWRHAAAARPASTGASFDWTSRHHSRARVDTSFFRGNYPEQCSLEASAVAGQPDPGLLTSEETEWTEILPQSQLKGDSQNPFAISNEQRFTHLRFKIYPDGGVARLRILRRGRAGLGCPSKHWRPGGSGLGRKWRLVLSCTICFLATGII